jgi:hypothetical protein
VHSNTVSLLVCVPCGVAAEAIPQKVESSCVRAIASHYNSIGRVNKKGLVEAEKK